MTVLDDIRLKLRRAEDHLNALSAEIRENVENHPITIRSQENPIDDSFSAFLENVPEVKREWGVMLGDFLHNTRSALDHLVCALVVVSGGTVRSRHQFPICDTPRDWERDVGRPPRNSGRLGSIDPSHVAIIESMQPYQATTGLPSLRILRDFSNADKHRLLHSAVISSTGVTVDGVGMIPLIVTKVFYHTPGTPLEEGANVARVRAEYLLAVDESGAPQAPDLRMNVNVKVKATTAFGEPGQEKTRIRDFRRCLKDAKAVTDRFAPVL
jgi:hypothetical protein